MKRKRSNGQVKGQCQTGASREAEGLQANSSEASCSDAKSAPLIVRVSGKSDAQLGASTQAPTESHSLFPAPPSVKTLLRRGFGSRSTRFIVAALFTVLLVTALVLELTGSPYAGYAWNLLGKLLL